MKPLPEPSIVKLDLDIAKHEEKHSKSNIHTSVSQ